MHRPRRDQINQAYSQPYFEAASKMSASQDTTYPSGAANTGDMNDDIPMKGLKTRASESNDFEGQPGTTYNSIYKNTTYSSPEEPRNVRLWHLVRQFEDQNQIVYRTLKEIRMKNNLVPSTFSKGPLGYTSLASAKKQGGRYEENAERLKNIKPLVKEYGNPRNSRLESNGRA
ncbi:hypothetical protein EIK77_006012 [Talaromyces pinophilus]|nr:hypothetical protein EIK77_006012 [Talaromyces pinophilus]